MPLRVSLVNLQKFTFHACGEAASIRMFAPAQKIFSLPLVSTTARDLGVLEPQPLDRVVQLDVHAEVVGVELQLVARGAGPPCSSTSMTSVATGPSVASRQCR